MEISTSGNREVRSDKAAPPSGKARDRARKKALQGQAGRASGRSRALGAARAAGRAGVFALFAVSVLALALIAFRSDAFNLGDVAVNGCRHQDAAKLEEIIRTEFPANILRIDLDAVRRRLEDETWVKRVALRRVLPSTLVVDVTERTPTAIVELGGVQMVADGEGVLLGVYGGGFGKLDSPIFKGFDGDRETYEMYEVNGERVKRGVRMLAGIAKEMPEAARKISEVDLSEDGYAKILMDDSPVEICLGGEDYMARLRSLVYDPERSYRALTEQGYGREQVEQIDLRFKSGIIFRLKRAKPAVG
ncbi:MAG: FtsQ-type POTRA domain-containing protein [Acidobacteriota bacterium]|jgi:cell division septal protein FtsQ|nr:FtsQ-type POTRA domain-containing protein [Acidobacteriota bacterium]